LINVFMEGKSLKQELKSFPNLKANLSLFFVSVSNLTSK